MIFHAKDSLNKPLIIQFSEVPYGVKLLLKLYRKVSQPGRGDCEVENRVVVRTQDRPNSHCQPLIFSIPPGTFQYNRNGSSTTSRHQVYLNNYHRIIFNLCSKKQIHEVSVNESQNGKLYSSRHKW